MAAEVGASVVVTVIGGLADTSILVHVSLRKLRRRIQHHFIDPGPEARSPAEARVIHSRYTLVYDGDDVVNTRRVVLNRLSDGSEIAFTGGRGVTVQSLAMLGLVASERHTLFRAISALRLYEDMAPWNLMVAQGAVEYVDSENRDRKLDQYLPVLGALSLYFQSFEEMAQLLGLCVGGLAGPTPYGKNVRALECKTLRLYWPRKVKRVSQSVSAFAVACTSSLLCRCFALCFCCAMCSARPFLSLLCAWVTVNMATRRPIHVATRSQVEYLAGRRTAHRPLISVYVTTCSRFREGQAVRTPICLSTGSLTSSHEVFAVPTRTFSFDQVSSATVPCDRSATAQVAAGFLPSAGCPSVTAHLQRTHSTMSGM